MSKNEKIEVIRRKLRKPETITDLMLDIILGVLFG